MAESDTLLIVFVKNAELGKAKTRIAKDVGDKVALEIYQRLLDYTQSVAYDSKLNLWVFYSNKIEENSSWKKMGFKEFVQEGNNLGSRMKKAFEQGIQSFSKVILIGSDCADLTTDHLHNASNSLGTNEVVFGPALDGGYYLIGMKKVHDCLFDNLPWSEEGLMEENISRMNKSAISFQLLEKLSDIDYLEDWEKVSWR